MLTARPFAPFDSIPLDAHRALLFGLLYPLGLAAAQKASAALFCGAQRGVGQDTVDPYAVDACRGANGVRISRRVGYFFWIQEDKIGVIALANQAALGEPEALCGHLRHLVDGLGQGKQFFLAAIAAKDA